MKKYSEKLRDPRWQKKRLEVLERDEWMCQCCYDSESTLHVHHKYYEKGNEPWEYPADSLLTLCDDCHNEEYELRPQYEKALLFTLRERGFLARDIPRITAGFSRLEVRYISEVIASFVEFILSDEATSENNWGLFWKDIHKRADIVRKTNEVV